MSSQILESGLKKEPVGGCQVSEMGANDASRSSRQVEQRKSPEPKPRGREDPEGQRMSGTSIQRTEKLS